MKDFYLDFDDYVHRSLKLHRVDHLFTRTLPIPDEGLYAGSDTLHSLWVGREEALKEEAPHR